MGHWNDNDRYISDINVTPLVDVMLVLLIIFMVTAPMMMQGVEVSLPQTDTRHIKTKEDPLILTVNKKQEIFEIVGTYQIESFCDLIDLVLTELPSAYTRYDLFKNHESTKSSQVFGQTPLPVEGTPQNINPVYIDARSVTKMPPNPVTEKVIPQAPKFEVPPPPPIN